MADYLDKHGTMTSDAAYALMLQRHGENRVATGGRRSYTTTASFESMLQLDRLAVQWSRSFRAHTQRP